MFFIIQTKYKKNAAHSARISAHYFTIHCNRQEFKYETYESTSDIKSLTTTLPKRNIYASQEYKLN